MHGLGTVINTFAVLIGGLIGIFIKKGIPERISDTVMKAVGLSVMFIGISGTLTGLLTANDGVIGTQGSMLLIISLILGAFIGELLRIEDKLQTLGEKLRSKIKSKNDGNFVEGFVTTTLIICIGAMAIVGSIQDGLTGDFTMLAAKSVLDGIISLLLASTLGIGVLFAALPLFIYQGTITLLAQFVAPVLSDTLILNLSYIGSALIFSIGINQVFGKKIKTGNLLPALLIPIIYEILVKAVFPLF